MSNNSHLCELFNPSVGVDNIPEHPAVGVFPEFIGPFDSDEEDVPNHFSSDEDGVDEAEVGIVDILGEDQLPESDEADHEDSDDKDLDYEDSDDEDSDDEDSDDEDDFDDEEFDDEDFDDEDFDDEDSEDGDFGDEDSEEDWDSGSSEDSGYESMYDDEEEASAGSDEDDGQLLHQGFLQPGWREQYPPDAASRLHVPLNISSSPEVTSPVFPRWEEPASSTSGLGIEAAVKVTRTGEVRRGSSGTVTSTTRTQLPQLPASDPPRTGALKRAAGSPLQLLTMHPLHSGDYGWLVLSMMTATHMRPVCCRTGKTNP